jgi:23S rRNA (adenine2503-C2)-methyltransferase
MSRSASTNRSTPIPAPSRTGRPVPLTRFDLSSEDLGRLLAGEPAYRVRQLAEGLYVRGDEPHEMTALPAALRTRLTEIAELRPALTLAAESRSEGDDTVKWLWQLHGGATVETVLMHYPDRTTVCVSTQAGCAMACSFCATGQAGFTRQLSAGEIVEQVMRARRAAAASGRRLGNVVFMGMGEPLANYANVWTAVTRLHDDVGISARHLTISTVGVVPGIHRLAGEQLPVNLAVSLHAANDDLRNQLVPINRTYPLDVLIDACEGYLASKRRRISFEWALIDSVNDTAADVRELAQIARPLGAHVNLIPLNPTPGYAVRGTSPRGVQEFRARLDAAGVNVTIRRNRGTSIDAACGQLAAEAARKRLSPDVNRDVSRDVSRVDDGNAPRGSRARRA